MRLHDPVTGREKDLSNDLAVQKAHGQHLWRYEKLNLTTPLHGFYLFYDLKNIAPQHCV